MCLGQTSQNNSSVDTSSQVISNLNIITRKSVGFLLIQHFYSSDNDSPYNEMEIKNK